MTREQVQDLLAMIQATYPNYNPPSKTAAVNAWFMALEEYNADEVAMAFKVYMKSNTSGFAPAPGQLIDKIHSVTQPQELNEMEAWALVSKALRNSAYNSVEEYAKLPILVQKAVGLPSQLREWAIVEDLNPEVAMSQFQRCYRAELKRHDEERKYSGEIKKLLQSASLGSPKAQIQEKRDSTVKSLSEKQKAVRIENKAVCVQLPERLRKAVENIKNGEAVYDGNKRQV